MNKQKNVQIPLDVFNDIVNLLLYLSDCAETFDDKSLVLYQRIDGAFRQKRLAMLNRDTYAEILRAKDDTAKENARNNYLATKMFYS